MLLSESGLYSNIATRTIAPGIIPYTVNAPFWSNGAVKERFIALPGTAQIEFSVQGNWTFPANTVLVKNFYLDVIRGDPTSRILVETRMLIKDSAEDRWHGFSYRWNEDGTDAVLLTEASHESFFILDEDTTDGVIESPYFYPGPQDCQVCHRQVTGSP